MPHRQDRLIQWLLGSLELQTSLFHLGQYCGSWQASTTGLARAGFHVILNGDCWLHLPDARACRWRALRSRWATKKAA